LAKNPHLLKKILIEIDETCIGGKSRHRSGGKTIKEMDTHKNRVVAVKKKEMS
jgi:hypothetical protein